MIVRSKLRLLMMKKKRISNKPKMSLEMEKNLLSSIEGKWFILDNGKKRRVIRIFKIFLMKLSCNIQPKNHWRLLPEIKKFIFNK